MTSSVKKFCHVWTLVPRRACVPVNSGKVSGAAKQFVLPPGWPWKHRPQPEGSAAGSTGPGGVYQPREATCIKLWLMNWD